MQNKYNALESSASHPFPHPTPWIPGKIVFHETNLWCQKGWGLLPKGEILKDTDEEIKERERERERKKKGERRKEGRDCRESETWRHKDINTERCWGVVWRNRQEQILRALR